VRLVGPLLIMVLLACLGGGSRQPAMWLTPLPGVDELLPTPEDSPLMPAGVALGERLFFDRRLSRDGSMACASCHRPSHAFADTQQVSPGVGGMRGTRNVPALVNRAWGSSHFWDGRGASLELVVLEPIENPRELDLPLEVLVARLRSDRSYRAAFVRAFGGGGITTTTVARALASYVRTLRSGGSAVDRFRAGDTAALSAAARRGLALFRGRANCGACHIGPNLTDERFHNTGVAASSGDVGRAAVTGQDTDRGAFRTPTLREVARTPPYMHDGSLRTLPEVVEFYDRGGGPNAHLDPEIRPLRLTPEEKRDLHTFLLALSGREGSGAAGTPPGSGAGRARLGLVRRSRAQP